MISLEIDLTFALGLNGFNRGRISRGRVTKGSRRQKRQFHQLTRILRAEFSHQMRAMAFERPVADLQPYPAFLVGAALDHETQNLALTRRQRFLGNRCCVLDAFAVIHEVAHGQLRRQLGNAAHVVRRGKDGNRPASR